MWKNPIFQERKKNVKKPYFSGEKKKCQKNPIFQERKKISKNPTKKKFFTAKFIVKKIQKIFGQWKIVTKNFWSFEKKIFGHFLVLKKKHVSKIFSPEILSIFFCNTKKISSPEILIFFFSGPQRDLTEPAKNLPSDQKNFSGETKKTVSLKTNISLVISE